jgi:hypothetical protein
MPSTRPLRWIEQAEARQVMTDAIFRRAPTTSWRKQAGVAIAAWLRKLRRQVLSNVVPEWSMLQAQPVLARRQDRRCRPMRRDDGHR